MPATQAPSDAQSALANNHVAAYVGTLVKDIRFRGAQRSDQSDLLKAIALRPGEPLTRAKLRDSLQTIYSSGRFKSIAVEVDPQPDKSVVLTFVVDETQFINSLRVYGAPRPPNGNQLINATKLQLGEELTEEKLKIAEDRIKRLMAEHGYFEAQVRDVLAPHPEIQGVDVNFVVVRGPHARVGQIVVEGDAGYPPEKIRSIAKLHPGDEVTVARLNRALNRLRKKYQKQGRLEAQVSVTDRNFHPPSNTLDYTFKIERGAKVDIRLEGASLRSGLMKKYIPVYEENAVDDDLLNEGKRNLRDYFQSKGYFDVKIAFKQTQPEPDQKLVIYDVDRGELHKLTKVEVQGNKYFDTSIIRERMAVQPADILLRHGRFSPTLLDGDIQSIENLYRSNGFMKVKVTSQVVDDYNGENGNLFVGITIDEGPQTLVGTMRLTGNHAFTEEQLRVGLENAGSGLETSDGQPYSDAKVTTDRQKLTNFYFDNGFPDVKVESRVQPNSMNPAVMDVLFKIDEGQQVFVDRVLVSGLEYTKPFIVSREFKIHDGDPLSQTEMLDTQRGLYDLSIFNQVDMAVQNPEGEVPRKNLLFQIEEARRYTFNYGVGFEVQTGNVRSDCSSQIIIIQNQQQPVSCPSQGSTGFSPKVSFDVTRINFRGRDHTLTLKTSVGRIQQQASLSYSQPHWLNRDDLTLTVSGFYQNSQNVLTFKTRRLAGSVQVEQKWRKGTTFLYRYTYNRVNAESLNGTVSEDSLPLFSRPVRVGGPSFTAIRDHRDNPVESHKGSYNSFDFSVAAGAFGSEANFTRLFVQNSTYHSFGKNKKRQWVFARSTRIGVENAWGTVTAPSSTTPGTNVTVEGFIPLPERFFAGSASSHRGFGVDQAGPRDPITGFPVGGAGLFINNFELRSPPIPLPYVGENLSGVIFQDSGNVFASPGDIVPSLFRVSQPDKNQCRNFADPNAVCNFNYSSHAVGLGVRYETPIGPVRFDVGYNLNPTTFPVRVFVQRGNELPEPPHSETLRRFNFYFSIGQTF